jgi:hypothetical protein
MLASLTAMPLGSSTDTLTDARFSEESDPLPQASSAIALTTEEVYKTNFRREALSGFIVVRWFQALYRYVKYYYATASGCTSAKWRRQTVFEPSRRGLHGKRRGRLKGESHPPAVDPTSLETEPSQSFASPSAGCCAALNGLTVTKLNVLPVEMLALYLLTDLGRQSTNHSGWFMTITSSTRAR